MLDSFKTNALAAYATVTASAVLSFAFGLQRTETLVYAFMLASSQYLLCMHWCRKDEKRSRQSTIRTGNITITGDRRSVAIAREAILQAQDEVI